MVGAEGWFVEDDQCSCFLSDFTTTAKSPILTSGVDLILDNARPQSAGVTQKLLEQFNWDVSDHLTNSPDLATSDFHLFPELKNWLEGQSYQKSMEIQSNVKVHLTSLEAALFEDRKIESNRSLSKI
ncbi:hypothetical protein AVEN_161283-1 [Araneus ventricosus]|uniref:Uncharacterized protein n=1 Tax=Araneus ventricosus TaxID=182803 RepID=A0A4Y2H7P2_ARAVE|nr:hypothetical protein AVEN_161283-1 [Araneus ventricosus]